MSFFQTSTGEAINADGSFSSGGGDFAPIPKGTRVLAIVQEAKITEYQGEQKIEIKWDVAQPAEFKGRKVFQKIKAYDTDTQTRDKAIRMLAAIDANAGGKLMASGAEPTNQSLAAALTSKMMVLKLDVWDMNGKKGNWVQEVSPRKPGGAAVPAPAPAPAPVAAPAAAAFSDIDDDLIPF